MTLTFTLTLTVNSDIILRSVFITMLSVTCHLTSLYLNWVAGALWSDPVCSRCRLIRQDSTTYFVLIGRKHGELGLFTVHSSDKSGQMSWVIWTLPKALFSAAGHYWLIWYCICPSVYWELSAHTAWQLTLTMTLTFTITLTLNSNLCHFLRINYAFASFNKGTAKDDKLWRSV